MAISKQMLGMTEFSSLKKIIPFNYTQNYKIIRKNKTTPSLYAPPLDNLTHNQQNIAIF